MAGWTDDSYRTIQFDPKGAGTDAETFASQLAANAEEIEQISKLNFGSVTYDLKDEEARNILENYATVNCAATKAFAITVVSASTDLPTSAAAKSYIDTEIADKVHTFQWVVADKLPTAAKTEMYKLYFIKDATGSFSEYICVEEGSTTKSYRWECIGAGGEAYGDFITSMKKETLTISFEKDTASGKAWTVIHTFKALANKDDATGSTSVSTEDGFTWKNATVAQAETSASTSSATATVSYQSYTPDFTLGDKEITAEGNVTMNAFTETSGNAEKVTGAYTPAGDVSITLKKDTTAATITTASYTPAGTASVAFSSGATINNAVGSVGELPSLSFGDYSSASLTTTVTTVATDATNIAYANEVLTFSDASTATAFSAMSVSGGERTKPTFSAGVLPTASTVTVTMSALSYAGADATTILSNVTYGKQAVDTASFTGSAANVVTGFTYDKADAAQSSGTFTGNAANATFSFVGTANITTFANNVSYQKPTAASVVAATVTPIASINTTSKTVNITVS